MGSEIDSNEELGMVGASPEKVKDTRKKIRENSLPSKKSDDSDNSSNSEESIEEKAEQLGLVFVDLKDFKISNDTLELIPASIAQELRAVPYLNIGPKLRVATDQEENINEIEERLKTLLSANNIKPQLVLTSSNSLEEALNQYSKEDSTEHISTAKEPKQKKKTKEEPASEKSLKKIESRLSKVSTTELFKTIMEEAVLNRASDVHIAPQESGARLRFRIDGVLQDVAILGKTDYEKVLSRIKYHGKIKMNVSQRPQDGRFEMDIDNRKIDIRLSSFPSIYGESIAMRLLEEEKEFYSLEELGFSQDTLGKINSAISKPYGMILNTGPTGSGKTTTLYAILDKLNSPHLKIITLEDPVEYHLKGVTQTQIDPEHDFPFKSGLKYALRQDPDIIMVGEIRDKETASTALHSSLTGHLMLSTFHTNNAASAFVRLLDMGIKPFLLIGSINIVIAQRLVRKLCSKCRQSYKPSTEEEKNLKHLAQDQKIEIKQIYKEKGCSACNSTGFKGRTAIGEAIIPNKELEQAILDRPSESKIKDIAQKSDMKTIAQNGVSKVLDGTTSLEELLRVVA